MKTSLVVLFAALALAACSGPAPTAKKAPAPADFVVDDLADNDANIQGCSTMLARVQTTEPGNVFVEDGTDNGAKGFIRIDGQLVTLTLVSAVGDEKAATRTFADAAKTVQVVEKLKTGEAHQEADSVDQSGSIAITKGGATQTIAVEGGTAC